MLIQGDAYPVPLGEIMRLFCLAFIFIHWSHLPSAGEGFMPSLEKCPNRYEKTPLIWNTAARENRSNIVLGRAWSPSLHWHYCRDKSIVEIFRYHTYRQEKPMLQQSNTEISLHHSNTYHFGFPNGPFQLAKWHVLVTHWKSMLYRGGSTDGIIWIILTTCYRCTLSITLLNEKNYSIYTMACNEHLSEATNATIMPCQSKFKW